MWRCESFLLITKTNHVPNSCCTIVTQNVTILHSVALLVISNTIQAFWESFITLVKRVKKESPLNFVGEQKSSNHAPPLSTLKRRLRRRESVKELENGRRKLGQRCAAIRTNLGI